MIITKSQLEKWVKIPENIYEITNKHIAEVEMFKESHVVATNLVTGHVLTCKKHPNSDHLHITTVDLGKYGIKQIVCGAPNVKAGQYVVVAMVGAILPGDFEIKEAKIRGVESAGMICSLEELGLEHIPDQYADGIFAFQNKVPLGINALEVLKLDGFTMELDLTPNRGDLLSVLGYAYDLAAATGQKITLPKYKVKEIDKENPINVVIKDEGCYKYLSRVCEVTIKPSPWWLQGELIKRGIKPINNVVDISNFILFEYGTPLHIFDYDLFGSDEIVIRSAKPGEEVETLVGSKHKLDENDIVITNGIVPTAIGGVMGLENTKVLPTTKKVIIEAAFFDPKRIKKTSQKLGIRTDSSLRFERQIDYNLVELAMETCAYLLEEYADAKVYRGINKAIKKEVKPVKVEITQKYINKALGTKLRKTTINELLDNLHFSYKEKDGKYQVVIPTRRPDISIDADVLEELLRMRGFDKVQNKPLESSLMGKRTIFDQKIIRLRHMLSNLGLNEVITYSLLKEEWAQTFNNIGETVSVLKPMTEEHKTLRQSLVNGLIDVYKYNTSRQIDEVNIFEIGRVFTKDLEKHYLSVLINSKLSYNLWQKDSTEIDFYTIKGLLEVLFLEFDIHFEYKESNNPLLHPYRQAYILLEDEVVGILGEVHPKVIKQDRVSLFEVDLDKLLVDKSTINYSPVSKYPNITRDIAFVIKSDIPLKEIEFILRQTARKHLVNLELFDVYEGKGIPEGMRSLAYRFVFNSNEKTLEAEDVDKIMRSVQNRLAHEFKAELR